MKYVSLAVAMATWAALPVQAANVASGLILGGVEVVRHGGGCRKASPPGQCCHAGTKPYHCH